MAFTTKEFPNLVFRTLEEYENLKIEHKKFSENKIEKEIEIVLVKMEKNDANNDQEDLE